MFVLVFAYFGELEAIWNGFILYYYIILFIFTKQNKVRNFEVLKKRNHWDENLKMLWRRKVGSDY